MRRAIRILLLDDHSVMRAGIGAIVASEPDLELVGAAGSEQELWPLLHETQPNVALVDLYAGASAVVSKASSTDSLLEAIRTVARAPDLLPPVSLRMRRETAARLDPADRPILVMRLAGYPASEIGETLRLPVRAVRDRLAAIIAGLEPILTAR